MCLLALAARTLGICYPDSPCPSLPRVSFWNLEVGEVLNSGLVGSQLWGLVGEPYEDMAHHRCPVHKPSLALTLDLRVFTGGPCLRCPTSWVGPLSWADDGGQGVGEEEGGGSCHRVFPWAFLRATSQAWWMARGSFGWGPVYSRPAWRLR